MQSPEASCITVMDLLENHSRASRSHLFSGRHDSSPLTCAIWHCRPELVELLLDSVSDIDKLNPTDSTLSPPPLHTALFVYGHTIFPLTQPYRTESKMLLEHHNANGGLESVRLLLEKGADPNLLANTNGREFTPFNLVFDSHAGQLLLSYNADLMATINETADRYCPLKAAVYNRSTDWLETMLNLYLVRHSEYLTAKLASSLLSALVRDANSPTWYAHDPADLHSRVETAKVLIRFGGDANYVYNIPSTDSIYQSSTEIGCCIDFAVIRRDYRFVEFLVTDANATVDQNTLFRALLNQDTELLAMLMCAAFGARDADSGIDNAIMQKWKAALDRDTIRIMHDMLDGGATMDLLMDWWMEMLQMREIAEQEDEMRLLEEIAMFEAAEMADAGFEVMPSLQPV